MVFCLSFAAAASAAPAGQDAALPHAFDAGWAGQKTCTVVFEDAVSGVRAGRNGSFAAVVGVDRTGSEAQLMEAGADLGIKPFGLRAMDSLRLEKSYRLPGRELSIEYAAFESGLQRFVHPNKGDFIGRDALVEWQQKGFNYASTTLEVHDVTDADALGSNPIYKDGKLVGRATSGGYGFRIQKSLVLAMVDPALSEPGTSLEIDILGKIYPCTVLEESPYDPNNERLRADG